MRIKHPFISLLICWFSLAWLDSVAALLIKQNVCVCVSVCKDVPGSSRYLLRCWINHLCAAGGIHGEERVMSSRSKDVVKLSAYMSVCVFADDKTPFSPRNYLPEWPSTCTLWPPEESKGVGHRLSQSECLHAWTGVRCCCFQVGFYSRGAWLGWFPWCVSVCWTLTVSHRQASRWFQDDNNNNNDDINISASQRGFVDDEEVAKMSILGEFESR